MAISFRAAGAVASGSAVTTLTLGAPAGLASTDVVLAIWIFGGGTGVTITPPSGWTLANRINETTNAGAATYWGLGTASFAAWGLTGVQVVVAFTVAYIGVDNGTPMDATAVSQTNAASATITAPSITTVTDNAWLIGCMTWWDAAVDALPTYSAEFGTHRQNGGFADSNSVSTASIDVCDTPQVVHGASGSKTVLASAAAFDNFGTLVALRPATAAVVTPIRSTVQQKAALSRRGRISQAQVAPTVTAGLPTNAQAPMVPA